MTATATEPWTTARHPLARLLRSVASGALPEADGQWARVSPWVPAIQAVVAFTGHTILAVSYDVSDDTLVDLGVDGVGGAFSARTVTALAGPTGWIGAPQVLHVALGTGAGQTGALSARSDLSRHPAVATARRTLQDVQVLAAGAPQHEDVVVLGRGVAGVREICVQTALPGDPRAGGLAHQALGSVPENEIVLLCVPAYDARGLMAAAEAGFRPVGGVQLFSTRPEHKL